VGCTLTVHAQDGNIVRVTSPLDHSVTNGHLCIKGRFGWQFVQIREEGLDAVRPPRPSAKE
jgi:predicted molibdopterin-dependent oxidoreductase YjgC